MAGIEFANFWIGLLLLGLGWNFLFIGGTTMLTGLHTAAERGKVQAANDFLVFAATAGASFMSGKLLYDYGWATVNLVALPFVIAVLGLTFWLALRSWRLAHRTA